LRYIVVSTQFFALIQEILDAAHNLLRTLPASLEFFWSDTLKYLILSYNKLDEIRWEVCRLKVQLILYPISLFRIMKLKFF